MATCEGCGEDLLGAKHYSVDFKQDARGYWTCECPICRKVLERITNAGLVQELADHMNSAHGGRNAS